MRVVVHRTAIATMLGPNGEVGRATARAAGRVRDRAKLAAPVDTGMLRNSIASHRVGQTATSITWRIGSDIHYAKYQEHGTGPIFARRAPMLVFKVKGRWVRTYSTRGVPAVHFLENAINVLALTDFS